MFKPEIRILGFDDGPFAPRQKESVPVVGVVSRGGAFLDGVLKTEIKVDGTEATDKLIKLVNPSRHKPQLKMLMLDGVTMGGFNVIDIQKLHTKTNLPVIVINRQKPNLEEVKTALKKFADYQKRWRAILRAGKIFECPLKNQTKVYYQAIGLENEAVEEAIALSSTHGNLPEPLRVAHLIATAVVKGESYGRA